MPLLQLGNEDARIIALAITYHLGRPGSETDRETLQHHAFGLTAVGTALAPRLAQARVELELTPYQLHRIDEALLGITNELKQYELAQRRSTAPGFAETLGRLFPGLDAAAPPDADSHDSALDLVERVVLLRRRLGAAVRDATLAIEAEQAAAADAQRRRLPWWRRLLHLD